jgi:hypothetical protein
MKETGKTIRRVDMAHTSILMGQNIRDNGSMIINMERELKHGLMEVVMRAFILKEKRMEKENTLGKTEAILLELGKIIKLMVLGSMYGAMDVNIKAIG